MAKDNTLLLLLGAGVAIGGAAVLFGGKAKAAPVVGPSPKLLPASTQQSDDGDEGSDEGSDDGGGGGGADDAGGGGSSPPAPARAVVPAKERNLALLAAQHAARLEASKPKSQAPLRVVKPAAAKGKTIATPMVSAPAPANAANGVDLAAAKKQAPALATHIRKKGRSYTHSELALFQRRAGIVADGQYGPLSESALRHFGVKSPPPALFPGQRAEYRPPVDPAKRRAM